MKSPIKFTIAALALGLLALPISRAQTPPTTPTPPPPPAGEHGEHHKEKGPRGDRFKMMVEKLNLTPEQQTKIKPIVEDEMKSIKAVWDDAALDKEAKHMKIEEIRKAHREQFRPLLTPEQLKKLEELKEEHGRGPGGPGGPAAPEKPKA